MVMRTTFLHNTIRPDTGLSLCFHIYSAIIVTYFEHFDIFLIVNSILKRCLSSILGSTSCVIFTAQIS